MHHYLSALAVLLILTSATSELAHAQANGCPEEGNDRARAQVMSMLDDRQDILQRDGIDVSPSELRLMTNDQDPDACAEIAGPALTRNAEAEDGYSYNLFFYATNHHYYKVNQLRPLDRWVRAVCGRGSELRRGQGGRDSLLSRTWARSRPINAK
ncbi:MAG: hypothetical protein PPP56_13670 [Longimonas sp.]|uniref:hypothetical protein n=1 Tax=Longimonas sp. TaxID=2039626 RepID=UPI00335EC64E